MLQKLQAMRQAKRHPFPGTLARYILRGDEQLSSVHMLLLWKDADISDDAAFQEQLAAFQAELADVLDWNSAKIQQTDALMYT